MSHQSLFEDVIGVPPPSTLDIDGIIVAQRRAQRWRRVGAGAGTGLAVAVVAGAAAVTLSTTPATVGSAPGTPTPTARYGWTPPADQAAFDAALTARLSPVARAAVLAVRPGLTLADNDVVPDTDALEFGATRRPGAPPTEVPTYYASVDVVDAAGKGLLDILVGLDADPDGLLDPESGGITGPDLGTIDECGPPTEETECTASTGPGGEIVIARTSGMQPLPAAAAGVPATVTHAVAVTKPDGTQVMLWATNFDRYDPDGLADPYDRAEPPFSIAELTEIALAPALTFSP
jgi:hypothetical protein